MAGRPARLGKTLIKAICKDLESNFFETACQLHGVDTGTARKWLKRGAKEQDGIYFEFRAMVLTALAKAEKTHADALQKNAKAGDLATRKYILEKRFPKRWGNQQRIELTGLDGGPIEHQSSKLDLSKLSKEELLKLREITAKAKPVTAKADDDDEGGEE
jgi:hypothetical protein